MKHVEWSTSPFHRIWGVGQRLRLGSFTTVDVCGHLFRTDEMLLSKGRRRRLETSPRLGPNWFLLGSQIDTPFPVEACKTLMSPHTVEFPPSKAV